MDPNENLVVIDADSLIYNVGYKNQDLRIEIIGLTELDEWIKDILIKTQSANYIGFFGNPGGVNFRYGIAKTVGYKSARNTRKAKEKLDRQAKIDSGIPMEEPWYDYWEPILKAHMKTAWKFQGVDDVEADDACVIAAQSAKATGKFKKVTIASPDKDLKQEPGWNYDYVKHLSMDIPKGVALNLLAAQMVTGDGADSIPGLPGAGPKMQDTLLKGMEFISSEDMVKKMRVVYSEYFKITIYNKELAAQEKAYLAQYKIDNDIKRFTGKIKSLALEAFIFDDSALKTDKDISDYFDEQYALLHMLETEEEGKFHGFILGDTQKTDKINWDEIITYELEIELTPDEEEFDFLDEL